MRPLLALIVLVLLLPGASSAAPSYHLLLGSRLADYDHLPLITVQGRDYLTLKLLDDLGLGGPAPTSAQDEQSDEHYNPEEGQGAQGRQDLSEGEATTVKLIAPPPEGSVGPPRAGRHRYRLAGHMLDLAPPSEQLAGELDGKPLDSGQLYQWEGHGYLDAQLLSELGLDLAFNTVEDLYQVVGLVHTVEYDQARASLVLRSLAPVKLEGHQVSDTEIMLVLYGGFIQRTEPIEFPGDPSVDKLGFKSQVELGRSFIFIHQPKRTGFKVLSDALVGFSRVNFGNYFQVASYNKTSSGEISLNIQLGASVKANYQLIPDPWRLVVDFPGAMYEEATRTIPVNIGRVEQVRIGTPEPKTVRVVLDLTDRADYRVLTKDHGARYFIQLLPPALPAAAPIERRAGRTIMVDPGHGGSDQGAPGVIPGVWEAPINLSIARLLTAELRSLGYNVIQTRTSDRFVSLGQRADLANTTLPYIFVSVHSNSIDFKPDMSGIMTFHHPASEPGPLLAADIQSEVIRSTGAVDKGVRTADFFVLRETIVPSVLVECGFLTNYDECERMTDPAYQQALAKGIAQGIDDYVLSGR